MTRVQYEANVEVIKRQMEQSLERATLASQRKDAIETAESMLELLKDLFENRRG